MEKNTAGVCYEPYIVECFLCVLKHHYKISYIVLFLITWLWVLCFGSILGLWFSFVMILKKMDLHVVFVHCCCGQSYVELLLCCMPKKKNMGGRMCATINWILFQTLDNWMFQLWVQSQDFLYYNFFCFMEWLWVLWFYPVFVVCFQFVMNYITMDVLVCWSCYCGLPYVVVLFRRKKNCYIHILIWVIKAVAIIYCWDRNNKGSWDEHGHVSCYDSILL